MSLVAVQKVSSIRSIGSSTVINTSNGSMGTAVTISASADFSLEPGINVTGLTGFYNIYLINTASNLTVTLPASNSKGWKCKIILFSATGSLTVVSAAVTYAVLTSTGNNYAVVDLIFTKSGTPWRASTNYTISNDLYYNSYNSSSIPAKVKLTCGRFFSYSGSTSVDVNTDLDAPRTIPWEFTSPGRYVDPNLFNPTPSSNTKIEFLRVPSTMRITVGLFIGTTGGAPLTNIDSILIPNGAVGFQSPAVVVSGSSTASVSILEVSYSSISGPNFFEVAVYKTAITVGTNPTLPDRTFVLIEIVSY